MTMIKAIRIDTAERRFHEVEIEQDNTQSICEFVGCSHFDVVRIDHHDVIFVDDEGLLTANKDSTFFTLKSYGGILVGNGLLLGTGSEGESIDPTTTIEWLEENVSFGKFLEIDGKLMPVLR
jgi:hypothetical protein